MSPSTESILRVFIVDDSEEIRARLSALLSEIEGVAVVGTNGQAGSALRAILALEPHVVILDLRLPDGHGLELLEKVKRTRFSPAVIVLTNYPYPAYRQKSQEAGADYFLDKSTDFDRIPGVIAELRDEHFAR